jgi:hypothetical protein
MHFCCSWLLGLITGIIMISTMINAYNKYISIYEFEDSLV